MELNDEHLAEIAKVFKSVAHGRITFYLTPEKGTLDFTVEKSYKIHLDKPKKTEEIA